MEINLGVPIYFRKGERGPAVDRVVVEPRELEVTHLVTEPADGQPTRKLVHLSLVEMAGPDRIVVQLSRNELANMPDYVEQRYSTPRQFLASARPYQPDLDKPPSRQVFGRGPVRAVEPPPSAPIELRNGALVEAVDGAIGQLDEVLLGLYENQITELVIRKYWPGERVRVPVEWVSYVDPTLIRLAVERKDVDKLVGPPAANYLAELPEDEQRPG